MIVTGKKNFRINRDGFIFESDTDGKMDIPEKYMLIAVAYGFQEVKEENPSKKEKITKTEKTE